VSAEVELVTLRLLRTDGAFIFAAIIKGTAVYITLTSCSGFIGPATIYTASSIGFRTVFFGLIDALYVGFSIWSDVDRAEISGATQVVVAKLVVCFHRAAF